MKRSRRGDIPHADFWLGKPFDEKHHWIEQIKRLPCAGSTKCSHKGCPSNRSPSPPPVKQPCTCYSCQHQHHEQTPPPSPSMSHGSENGVFRGYYCCTSSVKREREQWEPSPPAEKAQCTCQRPVSPPAPVCPGCHSRHASPAPEVRPPAHKPLPASPLQSCCSCRKVFGWEDTPATRVPTPTPTRSHPSTGKSRTKSPQAKCTCRRHTPPREPEIRHCDCCHKDYHSDTGSHISPYDDTSSDCSSVRVIPDYDREVDESRCGAYHRCRPKFDCRQGWVCGRK